ncbi:hypothetical protein ACWD3Z_35065 [Streptomyces sp. NPDC002740]
MIDENHKVIGVISETDLVLVHGKTGRLRGLVVEAVGEVGEVAPRGDDIAAMRVPVLVAFMAEPRSRGWQCSGTPFRGLDFSFLP